ncbi:MAG: ferritin family protein [Syntrophomonadaceae bacterium]|nr:ferritin family protein [Syntrophomonadaceae bacterium]
MKTGHLTLAEVIRMAVFMEERGASYYSSLQEKASDPKIKEILHRLTEDEKLHARQFTRILIGSSDLAATPISTGTRDYLKALYGKNFFNRIRREVPFLCRKGMKGEQIFGIIWV